MQISQFIIGAILGAIHLFIRYTVPVSLGLGDLAMNPPSQRITENGIPAGAAQSAGPGGDVMPGVNLSQKMDSVAASPRIAIQYQMVHCIDTTGQAFAIWLNVIYLMPLTYLFARFFIRSYLRGQEPSAKKRATQKQLAEQASLDALKRVSREIQRAVVVDDGVNSEDPPYRRKQATPSPATGKER
jgi:GNS1/SUR4 family